jgi:DNA-binding GntR family transcriptional regulator
MKSIDNYPAVKKAFESIEANLDNGTWKKGEHLPSISRLAQMAGVSRVSVIKAIGLLKEKGLVNSLQRHRLKAGGPETAAADSGEPIESWQRKRNLIEKEIVSGAFGITGRLPRVKELQARYGVCYRTMRKILHALETEGVVQPSGKGYVLPGTPFHSFRRRIVFITNIGDVLQESALNKEHNRIVNLLENECMRLGLDRKSVV